MASLQLRASANDCCNQFKILIEISTEINDIDNVADDAYDVGWIQDQFARFKMWAGNIGAFADGHASLDYRLRDHEKTQQFMSEFLNALSDFVRRAAVSFRPDPAALTSRADSIIGDHIEEEMLSTETSMSSAISSAFQGTETESVDVERLSPEALHTPLPRTRLQNIERAIDRLYRLSLIIRQPCKTARNEKAERFMMRDEEGYPINDAFAAFARHIVDHQFPEAPEFLRIRLADGILTRRKRFCYRQSHQRKLSEGSLREDEEEKNDESDTTRTGKPESTIRAFTESGEARQVKSPDSVQPCQKLSALSHTSASAVATQHLPLQTALDEVRSNVSTAFTAPPSMSAPINIPSAPKPMAGSKEFECPYCCLVLPIRESKALQWRRHVLEDLEPYACVFPNCSAAAALFKDRATWLAHLQAHNFIWRCTSKAHLPASFSSEEDYFAHMRSDHPKSFTEPQLPLLAKRSRVPAPEVFQFCPLCSFVPEKEELQSAPGASPKTIEKQVSDCIAKHLAAHLEFLAAKALPWPDDAEEEPEDRSNTGKAEDVTAQSEGGSQNLSFSDSTSLLFTESLEEGSVDQEARPVNQGTIPVPAGSYEEEWGFIKRSPYFGHDRDETLQPFLQHLFLGDFASTDFSGPTLPAYLVSVSLDRKFYGRDWALNAMRQTLCTRPDDEFKDNKPPTWPRCFAVYGPGGMGKTQVAANFVSKHRDEFDAILWVHAEDTGKIAQDYKDLAIGLGLVSAESRDSMDLDYTKDILKSWLVNPVKGKAWVGEKNSKKASWLLVFDGVEDGEILDSFWPYNGPGSVLVTSRNPYSWSASLELKPFNISEATQYLFHMTERRSSPEETAAATTIAQRLGGLPLALNQMGSFCASQNISFTRFLISLEQHEGSQAFFDWRMPDTARPTSNYESNVASVWAFDNLDKGSLLLINIIAMLDPDAIPERLFMSPIDKGDSELVRTIKDTYIESRDALFARSLITGNKREQKLFVHRLVQDVARTRMQPSDVRKYFVACVELINRKWKFQELTWRHGLARWADCEELFPHIQKLKAAFHSIMPSPDTFENFEFARLLIDSAWYQHERGKSPDAILSNNMAQSICESLKLRIYEDPSLATDNPELLARLNHSLQEITHNRGCIALEINEPIDALKYHKQFNDAMVAESKKHDSEDMRLAISWNELGNAYMLNRDWEKGESCFLQSIAEMRKYIGFKPTTISLPLANLGLAYWIQDKSSQARSTLLQGLRDREAEFGRDDRESFITGRFLHALGNVDSSLEYHRRALMHYKSTLGNRHHRTADLFVKVAEHNINLGNYEMALALLDHSLDAFSISHTYLPEKTRAGWMRYRALGGMGMHVEAETELKICYQNYVKLRQKREEEGLEIKGDASELNDDDIDDLIVFWSK